MEQKRIKLNNGTFMPVMGYGVSGIANNKDCETCVLDALNVGYRLIDTAEFYKNEIGVGNAIKKSHVPREEIFLTTKVWMTNFRPSKTIEAVYRSMERLQVGYIDLVLIHWAKGDYYTAWRELETLYAQNKIRAIGVSNFSPERLIDIIRFNKVKPAVNQIETNVFMQMNEFNDFMKQNGVVHQAWSPLAKRRIQEIIDHPTLKKIGERYKKTPTQIALKFNVQRGISVIPKTVSKQRMIDNADIFDFELSERDMELIRTLDESKTTLPKYEQPEYLDYLMAREL